MRKALEWSSCGHGGWWVVRRRPKPTRWRATLWWRDRYITANITNHYYFNYCCGQAEDYTGPENLCTTSQVDWCETGFFIAFIGTTPMGAGNGNGNGKVFAITAFRVISICLCAARGILASASVVANVASSNMDGLKKRSKCCNW